MSYQFITKYNSGNYTPNSQVPAVYGRPRTVEGITMHWWGDPTNNPQFGDTIDYLCRQGGNTSAHLIVEAGRAACIVDYADAAWHAGSAVGNATTIGIECNPRGSDADYQTIAELIADIRAQYGDLPLYPHRYWYNTACPGNYDLARLDRIARGIQGGNNTTIQSTTTREGFEDMSDQQVKDLVKQALREVLNEPSIELNYTSGKYSIVTLVKRSNERLAELRPWVRELFITWGFGVLGRNTDSAVAKFFRSIGAKLGVPPIDEAKRRKEITGK